MLVDSVVAHDDTPLSTTSEHWCWRVNWAIHIVPGNVNERVLLDIKMRRRSRILMIMTRKTSPEQVLSGGNRVKTP